MTEISAQIGIREPKALAAGLGSTEREARFTALVERQSRFVFRVAYAVLRNAQDAEDAVQDTFLKIYRSGKWEGIEDEKAFLARATWRVCIAKLPGRRKQSTPDLDTASTDANPEQAAIMANWDAIVHRLIDALPEELRQPLALSTVEELGSREIAAAMGLPEGTVRTRLLRARQILKQKLAAVTEASYEK